MYLTKITGFAARSMVQEGMISLPAGVANPPDYSFIETAKYVFPDFFAPLPLHYSMYGFMASVVALVGVSLATRKSDEQILDETMTGLYIKGRGNRELSRSRRVSDDVVKAEYEPVKR